MPMFACNSHIKIRAIDSEMNADVGLLSQNTNEVIYVRQTHRRSITTGKRAYSGTTLVSISA